MRFASAGTAISLRAPTALMRLPSIITTPSRISRCGVKMRSGKIADGVIGNISYRALLEFVAWKNLTGEKSPALKIYFAVFAGKALIELAVIVIVALSIVAFTVSARPA